jgi:NADPH:quinone reductase-like Zn-dependent oxidoreductase
VLAITQSRYGPPDVLRLEELPTPVPGAGEVLVRVRAASLNRTDLETLAGRPLFYRTFMGVRRPRNRRVGLDAAGEVAALGPGVTRFAVGDRVYADLLYQGLGAFAEYACAREDAWRRIPEGIDLETAATLPASAVLALQGLGGKDGVRPGDRVLIVGASGCVGLFAVQLAHAAGAEVTGVCSGAKADLVRANGAAHVIDHTREDFTRTGGSYDRILDAIAPRSVLAVRRVLADGGIYGAHGARTTAGLIGAMLLGPLLSLRGRRRMGIVMGRPNDAADLSTVGELVLRGTLWPVIDRRYPLSEVPEAYRRYASGAARGKLVITI